MTATKRSSAVAQTKNGELDADNDRFEVLEKNFRNSQAAFKGWSSAQERTGEALYKAIGHLAEFAAAVGNDHGALKKFAASKGLKVTKSSSPHTIVARLIADDRKKANKYASVLRFAAREGVRPAVNEVADFVKDQGGVEACVQKYRERPRDGSSASSRGTLSVFSRARSLVDNLPKTAAPEELASNLAETASTDGYFVIVCQRGEDGRVMLLQKAVNDVQLVRKVVVNIARETEARSSE